MKTTKYIISSCVLLLAYTLQGQVNTFTGSRNPVLSAVPFLSFAPDSRASAMGDVGVSTSPDVNSIHWNNGKLAFIDQSMGFSLSYSPWLGKLTDDMSLSYLSFFKKIQDIHAFGVSFRYFDLGEIQLRDDNNQSLGVENPNELSVDATYSRKLSDNMGIGATFRFVWSNIASNIMSAPDVKAASGIAVDLGWYYTKPVQFLSLKSDWSLGAHLSNIGSKMSYVGSDNRRFLPANLRLGSTLKLNLDDYNSLAFTMEINKLLVPTPPIYGRDTVEATGEIITYIADGKDDNRSLVPGVLGSFTDAPRGFKEELEEISFAFGMEYSYKDILTFRSGYYTEHENKGDRKYFTVGAGVRYQIVGFNFSYLIPIERNHPLADTTRISLLFGFK